LTVIIYRKKRGMSITKSDISQEVFKVLRTPAYVGNQPADCVFKMTELPSTKGTPLREAQPTMLEIERVSSEFVEVEVIYGASQNGITVRQVDKLGGLDITRMPSLQGEIARAVNKGFSSSQKKRSFTFRTSHPATEVDVSSRRPPAPPRVRPVRTQVGGTR